MSDLTGKAALVTGASRGIGATTVRTLAARGAAVAFTYASSGEHADQLVKEIAAEGGKAVAIRADAADAAASAGAVERAVAELGGLDILVNNVGRGAMGPFEEMPLDDLDHLLAVNVRSVVVTSQAAARHLREGGRIITVGSAVSNKTPGPGMTLYAMTKSALVGFTKGMARDLGGRGITANLVQPGAIDTEMNPADGPFAEFQRTQTALGRFGQAGEIAETIAFIAGDGGSYMTGSCVAVDGGHAA
ncbi:SDR family NAD(P)-dependent oxidoreductase [Phytomonospora endophytica]|uniref:3-oxoacyl-[acyl-carrier protein] reductase n=1 Tax=Phytomonospora endophytica TaxID=714109 RepID=A0A841G7G4_9ACTN|nr:SDR family oxidoreductase [Phytomonospora endophytica]MBB6040010.1 3-oxoacyl-[acyl-carrier protein] reductase [Phytomonospora endophytica]GIG67503.1 3-oxoacyl-ACP reductase [Phytomonospora endophytica]